MRILNRRIYSTIILPKDCTTQISSSEHGAVTELLSSSNHVLINGLRTIHIDENWINLLRLVKNKVETINKRFLFINLRKELEEKLIAQGVAQSDIIIKTVAGAMQDFNIEHPKTAKVNFIKGFIQATSRVLYIQTQAFCKQGKISIKRGDLTILPGEISGFISVMSEDLYYAVILCFPSATFLKIMSQMLDMTFTEINQDIQDGAAEILNIIYGQTRLVVQATQTGNVSTATVVVGNKISTINFEGKGETAVDTGRIVSIPFTSNFGEFVIEVWLPKDFSGNLMG